MRPATSSVSNFLNTWNPLSENTIADLYTFTFLTGEVLRYSGYQTAISAPAPNTNTPLLNFVLGPEFKRNRCKWQVGVQVDELEIDVYASASQTLALSSVVTWQDAVFNGLFDGALLELDRCFMSKNTLSPTPVVVGTVTWFYGRVGDIEAGRTKIAFKVKSLLDLLNVQMPKRLLQASCTFVFGDNMCLFNRLTDGAAGPGGGGPPYAQTITATAGTTSTQIHYTTAAPNPSTLFSQGTLIGATGLNTGYKRTIVSITSPSDNIIYLLKPWVFNVAVGDTFTMLPGCDHTLNTCQTVFNNLLHFGGFPYIPSPESAI